MVQNKRSSSVDDVYGSGLIDNPRYGRVRHILDNLALRAYPRREHAPFSASWLPDGKARLVRRLRPDIVNLHWVTGAMFQIESLAKLGRPVVWSLHDAWPFTGGCHVPDFSDCRRFEEQCGCCPLLQSNTAEDLSRRVWRRKHKTWQKMRMAFVAPSRWLAEQASASSLLGDCRIEVIPNALDTQVYYPMEKLLARQSLGLPSHAQTILFPVYDSPMEAQYKGQDLLFESLRYINTRMNEKRLTFVHFGSRDKSYIPDIGAPSINLGRLQLDTELVTAYSAADLFLLGSRSETMSYLIAESMSCGTPAVAFAVGGIPDLIRSHCNGILIPPFEIESFGIEVINLLNSPDNLSSYSDQARQSIVEDLDSQSVARRYSHLFNTLLSRC
ncbi:glycosyltransferase [Kamptonema cortianum]|nr:glycosyltransferase [Kamptonema cortianum]